jgi:hypothetical protein
VATAVLLGFAAVDPTVLGDGPDRPLLALYALT